MFSGVNPFKTFADKSLYCPSECICSLSCSSVCGDEAAWGRKS